MQSRVPLGPGMFYVVVLVINSCNSCNSVEHSVRSKTAHSTMSSQSMHQSGIIYLALKRHRLKEQCQRSLNWALRSKNPWSVRLLQVLCNKMAYWHWCPCPLNRAGCLLNAGLFFSLNVGKRFWDSSWCSLNAGFIEFWKWSDRAIHFKMSF